MHRRWPPGQQGRQHYRGRNIAASAENDLRLKVSDDLPSPGEAAPKITAKRAQPAQASLKTARWDCLQLEAGRRDDLLLQPPLAADKKELRRRIFFLQVTGQSQGGVNMTACPTPR